MGIFSLPAELARCSDLLLWFALPPWSPLRLTPCSSELDTLVLVLATPPPPPSPLPPLLPPLPTLPPLPLPSLPLASTPPTSPSPATAAPAIATTGLIGGYSTLGGHYYGKREAEAEPYLGYAGLGYAGLGYGYAGAYGYGKSAPCVNAANFPVPCRGFY